MLKIKANRNGTRWKSGVDLNFAMACAGLCWDCLVFALYIVIKTEQATGRMRMRMRFYCM